MADELTSRALELSKALDATCKALQRYFTAATAVGIDSPDGASYRGLDPRQVRRRLKCEVIARLSPKAMVGAPAPILELEGAPEARRFVAANPLPGLA